MIEKNLRRYGAMATFCTPEDRAIAVAEVMSMVPADAQDVEQTEYTKCHDCGAEYCQNSPPFFMVRWHA